MKPGWTRLGSAARYTRDTLTLREDSWRLPDGQDIVYPVLAVGVTVGVLAGEDPIAAAQRELREEGGYRAERFEFLTRFYPSNAYLDEVAYCYAAYRLTEDPLPADHDEFLERRIVPLAEAVRMALAGEITEAVSKVALLQHAAMSPRQYVARPPERS